MLRVVFFDLGATLIDADHRPFPHVPDALTTVGRFKTANGKPLLTALVSDFDMPEPPSTPAKIKPIVARYLDILGRTGLRPFFEPVTRRVTLSTQAGVMKPDAGVFRMALARLRSTASLDQCLLVTEHGGHVRAVRRLHMKALQFRSGSASGFDFDDWRQLPAMVAHLLEGRAGVNTTAALARFLHVAHAFDAESIQVEGRGGRRFAVSGTCWTPVSTPPEMSAGPVHVPFPAVGTAVCGAKGELADVRIAAPSASDVSEAAAFVRSLTRHGQVRGTRSQLGSAATHEIETDDQGRHKLVRKRFSAV
jgi:FMN phosphatase YigB (HAD superfamily)